MILWRALLWSVLGGHIGGTMAAASLQGSVTNSPTTVDTAAKLTFDVDQWRGSAALTAGSKI
jgi:hypothetical protein